MKCPYVQWIIAGEDENILARLKEAGIEARLVRNGIVVPLRYQDAPVGGVTVKGVGQLTVELPDELVKIGGKLQLVAYEGGGAYTKTGAAHIVCSLSGAPLRPLRIFRSGHLACSAHAMFVGEELCVVDVERGGDIELGIFEARDVTVFCREYWAGYCEDLPLKYERFSAAVEAALEKAACYHCRRPHYIAVLAGGACARRE